MLTKTEATASHARGPFVTAVAVCLLAGSFACAPDSTDPVQPTAKRGGIPGWLEPRKCFDAAATPVTFGAAWPLTNANGSDAATKPTINQVQLVQFEINTSCGIRVGSGKQGSPLAVLVEDIRNNAVRAADVTRALIDAGAVAVFGAGGSVTTPPAALVALAAKVPFGANQAAADALSGCTAADLASGVTPSPTPIYEAGYCWDHGGLFVRTATTGYLLGAETARYARGTYSGLTTAAIIYRDDDFGQPTRDGIRDVFEIDGTVVAEGGFATGTTPATQGDFRTLLLKVTEKNPSIILGAMNAIGLPHFMRAYYALRGETWPGKPSNFNTLRFVWSGTLAADFSDLDQEVRAVLASQSEFLSTSWDANSMPYQRWFASYRSFIPNAPEPNSGFYMAAYDAVMVIALAMTAAGTTDGPAVAAKLREVANPPGTVICPGQWRKAFRLLAKGKDIDYEGARGAMDLDERGNATGVPIGLFAFHPDGLTAPVRTFGTGPQIVCEDDEDEE